MLGIPGGVIGFLILINLIIFVLGFFLDFFEIAFILIPLLAPAASVLGIDLVWLGVMLAVNLQASYLTPPFGFALFFMRSVTPAHDYVDKVTGKTILGIKTSDIYRAGFAFVIIQVIMIGLLVVFPDLVFKDEVIMLMDPADVEFDFPDMDQLEVPAFD